MKWDSEKCRPVIEEALLQKEVKEYLEKNGWDVKEHVKRKDTINWEHSYEADLIIKHGYYSKLGWIGLELKDTQQSKTGASALKQIITKYQNHFFENIETPIHCWIIITNQGVESSPNIGNPYVTNYSTALEVGYTRICQQFGVALFDWKSRVKDCGHKEYKGMYGAYSKDYFNLIDLRSEAPEGKICLEFEGMQYTRTNEIKILNFLAKRTDFAKHFNLSNMKFLKEIKEGDSNAKLFKFS